MRGEGEGRKDTASARRSILAFAPPNAKPTDGVRGLVFLPPRDQTADGSRYPRHTYTPPGGMFKGTNRNRTSSKYRQ